MHVRLPVVGSTAPALIAPKVLQWHDYKVVVRDGHYTSYVNGQKLHEADLLEQPDPWLAVVGLAGYSSRAVWNIVITGEPDTKTKAPAPQDDRRGFFGGPNSPQRFVPGKTVVHPVLDRMVCLLEPDGVKIHWLTDGRFDRTGLLPGNVAEEPNRGPGKLSLKDRDWNTVKFAVHGDTLTITLNGEPVFTRPIDATNLRHFGLFHYANESNVRVRNIRYRGNCPTVLRPTDQQELAVGSERLAITPDSELPDTATFDFTGSKFEAADFAYHWDAKAAVMRIRPTAAGLYFKLPAGETKTTCAGLHPKLKLSGDFSVTIEYEALKTIPAKVSWGAGLSFKILVDNSYETGFEARDSGSYKATRAMWRLQTPVNEYHDESLPGFAESGRMRLQRRGPVIYILHDSEWFGRFPARGPTPDRHK
ncbi:MAG: DUF1583 domain-containing protein [Planctomycetota bacterium]